MRKYFFLMICALILCAVPIKAQKGMHGLGVGLSLMGSEGAVPGLGIKYQYYATDNFRLEGSAGFPLVERSGDSNSYFKTFALLNVHAFFSKRGRFRPYVLAGLGYAQFYKHGDSGIASKKAGEDKNGFALDYGLGLDCRLSHKASLQIDGGGLSCRGESGFKVNIGVVINF